ncbi:hypothetical protein HO173_008264 [Letharia columbiana]|uniref:Uncharacterized protein n=1 Tax=Letharia columbiana TaxID=112416 RepID=A0A8H6FRT5_9LECA|nr:uncharacterized protein HO173_008264 [Letharia columbiana]KAF6233533.1 hypothetical protein HO173_008264 [Letharia columbiana]
MKCPKNPRRISVSKHAISPNDTVYPANLSKAPEVIVGWEITFDPTITTATYAALTGTDDTRSQSSDHSSGDDDRQPAPVPTQSRYDRRGLDLLEAGAFSAYEFHKKIPEGHRAEEYTREVTKAIQRVNRVYGQKYNEKAALPQSFSVAKKDDEGLQYKKNGSRRRALTGREAADAEDQTLRRQVRKDANEKRDNKKFAEQKIREPSSSTHQRRNGVSDFDNTFSNADGDSDVEFLGTQPIQDPSQPPSEGRINTPSPLPSKSSLKQFTNIDDFDDFPPLSPSPPTTRAPPLISWPDRRSQQQRLIIPDDPEPTPSATTRASRGVASKSFKQARLESQQGHEAKAKVEKQAKKEAAVARKRAKAMKPRTEDVSQLGDALARLGSSPPPTG